MPENLGCSELFWGTGVSPPGFPRQPEATQGLLAGPGRSLQLSLCAGSWALRSWGLDICVECWAHWGHEKDV